MIRFFLKILVVSVIGTHTVSAQSLLQYRLNIGDSITILQEATQNIVRNEQGVEHTILNNLEENYTFKVSSKTDSTYTLSFRFNQFKLKTTSNKFGVLVDVDTDKPVAEGDTEGKIFDGLTLSKLQIEMSNTGKIIQVYGTDNMINNMINLAGIKDEFTKQLMIESMKAEFGSESLSKSFEQFTHIYPKQKVDIGDTWTNEFTGEFNSKNTWKLQKITDSIFLNAESTLSMIIKDEHTNLLLKGKQIIEVKADKKTGFIDEMIVNAEASNITNSRNPTKITSITTYKIK
ncbi:DUF6263 family protein [Formosa sp. PL04]|uniref:DUF6263 family protein n=1 Tax=Formosa sp. PL04 TaxID=3081755 RepID=UPI002980A7BD|nr:DUF6263 family protein [Formosa sp. PL04]MDW5290030.1 DUF6263 family protein [Formosa sp. PL04]